MVSLVKCGWALGVTLASVSFCLLFAGVLVCNGVLNVTCLAWLVLVMASMTACELALLTLLRWTDAG